MANDEIRTRITVDAEEAVRETQRAAQATGELGERTEQTGEQAEEAGRQSEGAGGAMGRMGNQAMQIVGSLMAAGTALSLASGLIRELRRESEEAVDAVLRLADASDDLAVNLGGVGREQVVGSIDRIVESLDLGENERLRLIQAAAAMTDVMPHLATPEGRPELEQRLEAMAPTMRLARGVGGEQMADVIRTIEAQAGVDHAEASRQAGFLLTSGFGARDVERMLQRGGPEALEAAVMARAQGIDMRRMARQMPRLIDELETGLDPEVEAAAGITEGMGFMDRLAALDAARQAGTLPGDTILDDVRMREFTGPLLRAMAGGGMEAARAEIAGFDLDETLRLAREGEVAELQRRSEAVERLRRERQERPDVAGFAMSEQEVREQFMQMTQDDPAIARGLTRFLFSTIEEGVGPLPGFGPHVAAQAASFGTFRAAARRREEQAQIVNNGQIYNRVDPAVAPPGGGSSDF